MKKLLLSLGSVAAIVAPVAAVVACGSSDDSTGTYKSYDKASFIALLKENGFESELAKKSTKFKEANATDFFTTQKMAEDFFDAIAKDGKIEAAVFAGTVTEPSEYGHNADDHIILIKGTATPATTGTEEQVGADVRGTAYDEKKVYTFETKYDLLGNGKVVDTGLNYWGIKNNEQQHASFAIWKTVNASTANQKHIGIAPIIKMNNNHFGTKDGYGFGQAIKSLNSTDTKFDVYKK